MTLFANSGIAWPNLEQETQIAGKNYLASASILFDVLSEIEGGGKLFDDDKLSRCARALEESAKTYRKMSENLQYVNVEALSLSEIEMAAVQPYVRRFRGSNYEDFDELFSYRQEISMKRLYLELSERVSRLASAVRTLKLQSEAVDLAPSVFIIFQLFESISIVARVIAVIGRRPGIQDI